MQTWQSNLIGTLNILETLRSFKNRCNVVIITSDKVYKNIETERGYRENDLIGGDDPYSASKGATEILLNSYLKSFNIKKNSKIALSIARAGNVIGGGDWSEGRLIPDCIKFWRKKKRVKIRNPKSTRPWQHVLEVLAGYLKLAVQLNKNKDFFHGQAFNFGPNKYSKFTVMQILTLIKKRLKNINWTIEKKSNFKEAKLLKLNSKKANKFLKWKCVLNTNETISMVIAWYLNFYTRQIPNEEFSMMQIKKYLKILEKKKMKVVILAGGKGSRLAEYTSEIPKPMVKILKVPILLRIINYYKKFGFKEFIIASGYKSKIIEKYFQKRKKKENVRVFFTGNNSMTGGRIKRLEKILKNERFLLTYGDGLCNVNIKKLIRFHIKNKNYVTLTAVRPPARFGGIKISGSKVKYFKEKSSLDEGWINGGFFVMEPIIFKYIKNDKTILERYPLEKISKLKKLGAFKHHNNWQCMDTIRDKTLLEQLVKKKFFKLTYKILITGASGFLGINLISRINKLRNFEIHGLVNKSKKKFKRFENIKYIKSDITNKKELKKKIDPDYDCVINFAGNIDHGDKIQTLNAHYVGLKNLIKIIDIKKIKLFIQVGSSLEYGRKKSPHKENQKCFPVSNYGKAKLLSTKFIMKK